MPRRAPPTPFNDRPRAAPLPRSGRSWLRPRVPALAPSLPGDPRPLSGSASAHTSSIWEPPTNPTSTPPCCGQATGGRAPIPDLHLLRPCPQSVPLATLSAGRPDNLARGLQPPQDLHLLLSRGKGLLQPVAGKRGRQGCMLRAPAGHRTTSSFIHHLRECPKWEDVLQPPARTDAKGAGCSRCTCLPAVMARRRQFSSGATPTPTRGSASCSSLSPAFLVAAAACLRLRGGRGLCLALPGRTRGQMPAVTSRQLSVVGQGDTARAWRQSWGAVKKSGSLS